MWDWSKHWPLSESFREIFFSLNAHRGSCRQANGRQQGIIAIPGPSGGSGTNPLSVLLLKGKRDHRLCNSQSRCLSWHNELAAPSWCSASAEVKCTNSLLFVLKNKACLVTCTPELQWPEFMWAVGSAEGAVGAVHLSCCLVHLQISQSLMLLKHLVCYYCTLKNWMCTKYCFFFSMYKEKLEDYLVLLHVSVTWDLAALSLYAVTPMCVWACSPA